MKLWVLTEEREDHPIGRGAPIYREATIGELVEVLKQEGAEVVDVVPHSGMYPDMCEIEVDMPGRYLILPLGDTP